MINFIKEMTVRFVFAPCYFLLIFGDAATQWCKKQYYDLFNIPHASLRGKFGRYHVRTDK